MLNNKNKNKKHLNLTGIISWKIKNKLYLKNGGK